MTLPRLAKPTAVRAAASTAANRIAAVMRLRRFGFGTAAGCFSISTLSQCGQNEASSGSAVPQCGQCFSDPPCYNTSISACTLW